MFPIKALGYGAIGLGFLALLLPLMLIQHRRKGATNQQPNGSLGA